MKNCHFLDATTQGFPNVHIPIPDIRPVLIGTARRQRKILTSWMIMGIQNGMVIYPLVNSHITMERSTIFHGKIHYFDWVIFNSYVKLPEGNQQQVLVGGWASEKYSSVGSVGWLFAIYGKKICFFSKPPTTIQNLTIQNKNGISPTTIGISTIQLIGF